MIKDFWDGAEFALTVTGAIFILASFQIDNGPMPFLLAGGVAFVGGIGVAMGFIKQGLLGPQPE